MAARIGHGYRPSMNGMIYLPPETSPRQRILVVDDEPRLRQLNARGLASQGYEVAYAEDGAAAWDELRLNHYDLLITDNDMPRLSGLGLIRRLQDAHLTVPVIMVTGTSPQEELARHPELHVEALLLKPCTLDELLAAVKNVLREHRHGPGKIVPPTRQRPSTADGRRLE